jgi:D-arabinose 5-phosphate isomerase GutQ
MQVFPCHLLKVAIDGVFCFKGRIIVESSLIGNRFTSEIVMIGTRSHFVQGEAA